MTAPSPSLRAHSAKPLAVRYDEVRAATRALTAPLSEEDCQVQSMEDASPAKWHLAHTSWFFETFLLEPALPGYRRFHDEFRFLFNSYYNAVGEQYSRPHRGLLSRPSLAEVERYRSHVDEHMRALLDRSPADELTAVVELGLHHEQQHQELILTDIKHMLGANPLRPAYREGCDRRATPTGERKPGWLSFGGGVCEIGHAGDGFCFDNERPRHRVFVEPFEIADALATCGAYVEFIRDGGYTRPEFWLSDGWAKVDSAGWKLPLYWDEEGGAFFEWTLGGRRPVDANEPVCHLSLYEADAFARWSGARLPTEAEWEVAAVESGAPVEGNFVERGALHPQPAADDAGPAQLYGDVWEWTGSAYRPYPGYTPGPGALGEYNGKFMSGQMVLRGGSCATPASHVRASYRNFFPPDARWQFSGVRFARDAS